jgi:hypothetical protein
MVSSSFGTGNLGSGLDMVVLIVYRVDGSEWEKGKKRVGLERALGEVRQKGGLPGKAANLGHSRTHNP